MKYFSLVILLTAANFSIAQPSNFNTQRNWSRNKKEVTLGLGGTNFLGDLGGANGVGTDYSVKDWDFPSTGLGMSLGYRYRWHPYYATSTIINFGRIRGNDAQTEDVYRNDRNLHFRSNVINISQRFELILLANEKVGKRYNIPGLKGMSNKNSQLYIFTGMGCTYYNPKAQYNGQWVELHELHTEGQGLPGGPEQYSRVTATIPFGMGVRMGMGRMWRVGLELTYVKTFSDYLDDVHGTYYDPAVLLAEYGEASAALSNPAKNPLNFEAGGQRGDKQNDAMFYFNLTITRNLTYSSSAPKGRIRFQKYRAKF